MHGGQQAVATLLSSLARDGITVMVEVTGRSMWPLLRDGDRVELVACAGRGPDRGELVFYRHADGAYYLHRVVDQRGACLVAVGDSLRSPVHVIPRSAVLGRVRAIHRRGLTGERRVEMDRAANRLYAYAMVALGRLRCTRGPGS